MPTIKELNGKLRNLRSTRKITAAMKLVASSKLRRSKEAIERSRVYRKELTDLLAALRSLLVEREVPADGSPWLVERPVRRVALLVVSSDKGLCGSFNSSIVRAAERVLSLRAPASSDDPSIGYTRQLLATPGVETTVHFAGKKAWEALRGRVSRQGEFFAHVVHRPSLDESRIVSGHLSNEFLEGRADLLLVLRNRFENALRQIPEVIRIHPTEPPPVSHLPQRLTLFSPAPEILMGALIPQAVHFLMHSAILENAAGEHAARMAAMDNATRNTDDMIARTSLARNRARQAAITRELIEIISGAESLKS